jgi:hypothetical protein
MSREGWAKGAVDAAMAISPIADESKSEAPMKRPHDLEATPAIRRASAGRLRSWPNLRNLQRRLGDEAAKTSLVRA